MTKEELSQAFRDIEASLNSESATIFTIVTDAIMKEVDPGTMYVQDIIDGLEAVLKVTRLKADTESKGH